MSSRPRNAWSSIAHLMSVGFGLLGVGLLAAHPISSADTFWHIKLGEIIAQTGSVPQSDLFSAVHPDRAWVQFAWLWEVLAYGVVSHAGLWGLRLMQAALMACSVGSVFALMRRVTGHVPCALLAAACALGLFVDRFQARPDAFNLLLATLATPLVLRFRSITPRSCAAFGALALFWVNLHAGTSLLLGCVLSLVIVGTMLNAALGCGPDADFARARVAVYRAAILFGLWLAALVLTPHALTAIVHFSSALAPIAQAREPEWSPSFVLLEYGTHPALYVTAFAPYLIAISYVFQLRRRYREAGRAGLDFAEIVPCLALLVLGALVTRNLFVCLLPLCFVLARSPRVARTERMFTALALVVTALVFDNSGRVAYGGFERAQVAFRHDLAPGVYPEHAARFMREAGIRGNVLNFPRWGDYLIERLYPQCRVFFDSRRDVTQEMVALLGKLGRLSERASALDTAFQRFGIELVVYEAPLFPMYQPRAPWSLLFKAGPEEVYQHERGPHAQQNLERAALQLTRDGVKLPPESEEARASTIVAAGSRRFLADPWQQLLLREQQRDMMSSDPQTRLHAQRTLGLLLFRAGAYARATEQLRPVIARDPADASARYHLAFALYLLGDTVQALELARTATLPLLAALSPAQRFRFEELRKLAAHSVAAH